MTGSHGTEYYGRTKPLKIWMTKSNNMMLEKQQPVWCIYLCKCALPVIAIVKYQSEYKRGTILF